VTDTPTTFSPPRQARSRQSLERYLDAAEALIRTNGFADLNITEVARLAGFSVGGIYSRFPSKLSLLSAVRERFLERVETHLSTEYEAGSGNDASLEEAITRMLGLFFRHFIAEQEVFRAFVIETPNNPGFEEGGEVATERRREMFREALVAHAGEIRRPDPEAAIDWVFTVVMALIRERLVYGEAAPITGGHTDQELLTRLVQTVFVYLSAPLETQRLDVISWAGELQDSCKRGRKAPDSQEA